MTLRQHLKEIDACRPALDWVGDRTARQAWEECDRLDWLIWWVARTHPELRRRIVLLLVREMRARTLGRAGTLRDVAKATLDAAEAWAVEPTDENRLAAYAAAYAAATAAAAAAATAADAAERALWLTAIRAEFECPWSEDEN